MGRRKGSKSSKKGRKGREVKWSPVDFDDNTFRAVGSSFEGLVGFEEVDASEFFSKKSKPEQVKAVKSQIDTGTESSNVVQKVATKNVPNRKRKRVQPASTEPAEPEASSDDDFAVFSTHRKDQEGSPTTKPSPVRDAKGSKWRALGLHERVVSGVVKMGYMKPTPIQTQCVPLAGSKRRDIIAAAATGSGKTLAFCLPVLHRLCTAKGSDRGLKALVLTPTRDLALQIVSECRNAAVDVGMRVEPVVGGLSVQKQQRVLRRRPQMVVGTPGRLWALMSDLDPHLTDLKGLEYLILDEADRMLELGHFRELQQITDVVRKRIRPGNVQVMLFSATMTLEAANRDAAARAAKRKKRPRPGTALTLAESMRKLRKQLPFRGDPVLVDLSSSDGSTRGLSGGVQQYALECVEAEKDMYLYYALAGCGVDSGVAGGKTLVFVNAISCLRRLSGVLDALGVPAFTLHAKMQQRQRLKNLDRFRKRPGSVIIASDVAARGLDIKGVTRIVHYQLPRSAEVYIHRCGRTGRAGRSGVSIAIVGPGDRAAYARICSSMSRGKSGGIDEYEIDSALWQGVQDRVALAQKIDVLVAKKRKVKTSNDWFRRNAEAMDIALDDDMLDPTEREMSVRDRQAAARLADMQRRLAALLAEPLVARGVSRKYFTRNSSLRKAGGAPKKGKSVDLRSMRR